MRDTRGFLHPFSWLAWTTLFVAFVLIANNPFCSLFAILMGVVVTERFAISPERKRMYGIVLAMIVIFSIIRVVIFLLTTHSGGDSLGSLPSFTVPRVLGGFQIGGSIEVAVLRQTLNDSLILAAVVSGFLVLSSVVLPSRWLAVTPRALFVPSLTILIGMAAIPSFVASVRQAREADFARVGMNAKSLKRRRFRRILMPVVDDALEHAVGLSETLETRGFGSRMNQKLTSGSLLLLASGSVVLIFVAVGWYSYGWELRAAGVAMAILMLSWSAKRLSAGESPRYRPLQLTRIDVICVGISVLAVATLLIVNLIDHLGSPWMANGSWTPQFSAASALFALSLIWPLVLPMRTSNAKS